MTAPEPTPRDTAWTIGRDLEIIRALAAEPTLAVSGIQSPEDFDQTAYEDELQAFKEIQLPWILAERMPLLEKYLDDEAEHTEGADAGYLKDPEQQILDAIRATSRRIRSDRYLVSLLVAYAREFTPDPPRLVDLAEAADVSKTHISRLYGNREIAALEDYLDVTAPRSVQDALRARHRSEGTERGEALERPRGRIDTSEDCRHPAAENNETV